MKRLICNLFLICFCATMVSAQEYSILPKNLISGPWRSGHVQGIAVDAKREYLYLSFTTMLVKMNMKGEVVGTVTGLFGHLGCIEYNEEDGRIYGSLEYKDDSIGKNILKHQGVSEQLEIGFYVAIFDVDKITREGMDAERDGVMTTVLLKRVVDDYKAKVTDKSGKVLDHRYGCSGFDGISFGPAFDGSGKRMLTIAYGIYRDVERTDNDHQVLLQYDTRRWAKYEAPLSQGNMHQQGPAKPNGVYFVYTGNTSWGVQNLEYDKELNIWFLACYPGKKKEFANYTLFAIDGSKKAVKKVLRGVTYEKKMPVLQLANCGHADDKNPEVRGWYNKIGAYGIESLGDGYYYVASGGKSGKLRTATLHLARFDSNASVPFVLVE